MSEYIDRAELKKRFCGHCEDYGKCKEPCFDMKLIDNTPAADVRPVKHGQCTDDARYFFCSECGYGVQDVYEGNYRHENEVLLFEHRKEWNYCPNCGTEMEKTE